MTTHLRLAVYEGRSEATVPVTEYLERFERGDAPFTPYLGMVNLDLTVDGRRRWPQRAGVGDLARWAVQMEAAAPRIEEGREALVRSAVDDGPVGGYFLFEPDGDVALVSMLAIADPEVGYRYPVAASGEPVEEIYEYVRSHRDELVRPIDDDWRDVFFENLPFPRPQLVESFRREASAGRRLYDVLGVDFYLELY